MNHEEGTVREATQDTVGKKKGKTNLINNNMPSDNAQASKNQNKQNRRKRKNNKRRKRNRKRKKEKKRAEEQRYYDILAKAKDFDLPNDMYAPKNNTDYQLNDAEKSVLELGLKFVPTTKRYNRAMKYLDLQSFFSQLRLRLESYKKFGSLDNDISDNDSSENIATDEEADFANNEPWRTKNKPFLKTSDNEALEHFIANVESELLDPKNEKYVKDNLTSEQREAIRNLGQWNCDPEQDKIIRIQDKGSNFVIDKKDPYIRSIENYLNNPNVFRKDNEDKSLEYTNKVRAGSGRWFEIGIITEEERDWVIVEKARPGTIYGNIKVHKENWPLRYIMSCNGTSMEKLARWVEFKLKESARSHPAFLKDTSDFLKFTEDVNDTQGPFEKEKMLLITRDISNFYPNCDTDMCLDAVKTVLQGEQRSQEEIECILDAVSITMSTNHCEFLKNFYTQVNGATIGGPDSGSVTDIYGGIHIDKKILEDCPIDQTNYKRYRDDTANVEPDSTEEEQQQVTEWLNANIYPGKIKFECKTSRTELEFLDVTMKAVANKNDPAKVDIATDMYSKPTDTHQYLSPQSSHWPSICQNIPLTVITRIRKNCSHDEIFEKRVIEYKAYLLQSGYKNDDIDQQFVKGMKMERRNLLTRKKDKKSQQNIIRFITPYEPSFPDVYTIMNKHARFIKNDPILQKVFPRGVKDFRVTYRRESKNIKERITPSSVNTGRKRNMVGRSEPCGKNPCVHCNFLRRSASNQFYSIQMKQWFRIRQIIKCTTENVIYLVTCAKHNVQGVGHTKNIKSRISNYSSKINNNINDCRITKHFLENDCGIDDFIFQPIVALENPLGSRTYASEC